jgi:anaerobic ribonucleoside-triphosphate reductase activating protein
VAEFLTSDTIHLARIQHSTNVEGPGVRSAIWVAGCSIKCVGCFNPHLWDKENGFEMTIKSLVDEIVLAKEMDPSIEGITWLGGEPFEQAIALAEASKQLRAVGFSVMTFTGFKLSKLTSNTNKNLDSNLALLEETDLLVDGPFVNSQLDNSRPWLGSVNQEFVFLTDRYSEVDVSSEIRDGIEIRISESGEISVNGWAEHPLVRQMLSDL